MPKRTVSRVSTESDIWIQKPKSGTQPQTGKRVCKTTPETTFKRSAVLARVQSAKTAQAEKTAQAAKAKSAARARANANEARVDKDEARQASGQVNGQISGIAHRAYAGGFDRGARGIREAFKPAATTTVKAGAKTNAAAVSRFTARMQSGAITARAAQGALRGDLSGKAILKTAGLEAKASFYESVGNIKKAGVVANKNKSGKTPIKDDKQQFSTIKSVGNAAGVIKNKVLDSAKAAAASGGDTGTAAIGGALKTAAIAATTFKLAQSATSAVFKGVKTGAKVGIGAVDLIIHRQNSRVIRRVVKSAKNSVGRVKQGASSIKASVVKTGEAIRRAGFAIKNAGATVKNATGKLVLVSKGVITGSVNPIRLSKDVLAKGVRLTAQGAKVAGRAALTGAVKGAVKGGVWTVKKGVPGALKTTSGVTMGVGNLLAKTDNTAVQAVGYGMKAGVHGLKTANVTLKTAIGTAKTTYKAGFKTIKTAKAAVTFIHKNGFKSSAKRLGQKMGNAAAKAGRSIVNAAVDMIKGTVRKVIAPIIILIVAIVAVVNVLMAPVQAIGALFGGIFSSKSEGETGETEYVEIDFREYISDANTGVPKMRADYIAWLADYIHKQTSASGAYYDLCRLYVNGTEGIVDPTIEGIGKVFYKEEDLINIIQPILNAIILQRYELEPTADEARAAFDEIFNTMMRLTEDTATEYCGQEPDGPEPAPHTCDNIHAFADCPNYTSGTHPGPEIVCEDCDEIYYDCKGYTKVDHITPPPPATPYDNYHTSYCGFHMHTPCYHSDKKFQCAGYKYCLGHSVLKVTLNMDGVYELLYRYFQQPMDELANLYDRTDEQETELANLISDYEIACEYIAMVGKEYGGGMTIDDLGAINWVIGSRGGYQSVVDLALTQVGNMGGREYWLAAGFNSRVAWCACFAEWVYKTAGLGDVYAASSNNYYCQTLVNWLTSAGKFEPKGYTDLAAGDLIFFDWDTDGYVDHVGIVIGRDDQYVYTVEGNSGDAVRVKCYDLSSVVIYGYAKMSP